MSPYAWLFIGLGLVILVVVLVFVFGGYKPYVPTAPNYTTMSSAYQTPSPWGSYEVNAFGDPILGTDGSPIAIPGSNPVSGPSGTCTVYTFRASSPFTPGFPSTTDMDACSAGTATACSSTPGWYLSTCVDDDQTGFQEMTHTCLGNSNLVLRSSGECLTVEGDYVSKGSVEKFWETCPRNSELLPTVNRCQGDIGLIILNINLTSTGDGALSNPTFTTSSGSFPPYCLSVTDYEVVTSGSSAGTLIGAPYIYLYKCDMTQTDNYGFPAQLFRIQGAQWTSGVGYTPDDSGSFLRFVHRPTGLCIAPTFLNQTTNASGITVPDLTVPIYAGEDVIEQAIGSTIAADTNIDDEITAIFGEIASLVGGAVSPLQLIDCNVTDANKLQPQGYWWYLAPSAIDPNYSSGSSSNSGNSTPPPLYGFLQDMIYTPDPSVLPDPSNVEDSWAYAIANVTTNVMMSANLNVYPPIAITNVWWKFNTYSLTNAGPTDYYSTVAQLSQANYFNASILPMILSSPTSFNR